MTGKGNMISLYDMLGDLITLVRGVSDFADKKKNVREYNNEFEEGGEWNPALPCCLIAVTGSTPVTFASDRSTIDERGNFTLYVADTCPESKSNKALKVVDNIREAINGADFTYDTKGYVGMTESVTFIGKEKAMKVYAITGAIIP